MIRVELKPEPLDFQVKVRTPGLAFLKKHPAPTKQQWKDHAYWTNVSGELFQAYGGICAYSCHSIPCDTGWRTTEHFKPKNSYRKDAYEWSNYRLVCGMLNGRKGTKTVLDPFVLPEGHFVIKFPSLLVVPREDLADDDETEAWDTVKVLGLNDEGSCLQRRRGFVVDYCEEIVPFRFLEREAPFLASEITRQQLVDSLPRIMGIKV